MEMKRANILSFSENYGDDDDNSENDNDNNDGKTFSQALWVLR